MDLRDASSTFPELPPDVLLRDNVIKAIQRAAGSDPQRKVVVLNGPTGSGKTTVLAQMAAEMPGRCITYFVGHDIWSTDPRRFLFDMCQQILALCNSPALQETVGFEQLKQVFSTQLSKLFLHARRQNESIYFVVDSIDTSRSNELGESIGTFLPTDLRRNLFLVCSASKSVDHFFSSGGYSSLELPDFSIVETQQFLKELDLDESDVRKLHSASHGLPAYLSEAKRLIKNGTGLPYLVDHLPPTLDQLIDTQFDRVNFPDVADFLVPITFAPESLTLTEWANLLNKSVREIVEIIQQLPFLRCRGDRVDFILALYRERAQTRLAAHRDQGMQQLIAFYRRMHVGTRSMTVLPTLLSEAGGQFSELKGLLSTDQLTRTLGETRDLGLVRKDLAILTQAAFDEGELSSLLQYSFESTVVRSAFLRTGAQEAEIRALTSLGRFDEAVELVRTGILPQDQLVGLALIGGALLERGLVVPEEIEAAIGDLAERIPPTIPIQEAGSLAGKVFPVHPEAAIQIIERCAGTEGPTALDHALATMGLMAQDESPSQATDPLRRRISESTDRLRSRIRDETIRDFVASHPPYVPHLSAQQVLAYVVSIQGIAGKLFLLRDWCRRNTQNPEGWQVIDRALDLIEGRTDYTTSLRVLRHLCAPLTACETSKAKSLVAKAALRLEGLPQRPLIEWLQIQILLIKQEIRWSPTTAQQRFGDLRVTLERISDHDVLFTGYAYLLAAIAEDFAVLEQFGSEISALEVYLNDAFSALIINSVDQYDLARRGLVSLARVNQNLALRLVEQLNTEHNRARALADVLTSICESSSTLNVGMIAHKAESIRDASHIRGPLLVHITEILADRNYPINDAHRHKLSQEIDRLPDPAHRALAHAWRSKWLKGRNHKLWQQAFQAAEAAIGSLDEIDEDSPAAYDVIEVLATVDLVSAERLFDSIRSRGRGSLLSPFFVRAYADAVPLQILALRGVFEDPAQGRKALAPIQLEIERVPSISAQVELLAQLAAVLCLAEQESTAKRIALQAMEKYRTIKSSHKQGHLLELLAPVLARCDRGTLRDLLSHQEPHFRDKAVMQAIIFLVLRLPPGMPFDDGPLDIDVDFSACDEALQFLSEAASDMTLEWGLALIADQASRSANNRRGISNVQLVSLADKIDHLADNRLPDPRNIKHRGYRVLAMADAEQLRIAGRLHTVPDWTAIEREILTLPNIADRVLVYCRVAENIHRLGHKHDTQTKQAAKFLEAAANLLDIIPSAGDRARRSWVVADAYWTIRDTKSATHFIRKAFDVARDFPDTPQTLRLFNGLLETSHSIDPELASELTPLLDGSLRQYSAERTRRALELRKRPSEIHRPKQGESREPITTATYQMLRSIQSGRGVSQNAKTVRQWLQVAAEGELPESLGATTWVIENARIGWTLSQRAVLLDSTRHATEFVRLMGSAVAGRTDVSDVLYPHGLELPEHISIFKAGQRDEALSAIRSWLISEVHDYLIIVDPYFTIFGLSMLSYVPTNVTVNIIANAGKQKGLSREDIQSNSDLEQIYATAWRESFDQDPPLAQITILGTKSGQSPLHDRYMFTASGGLRLGTSIGGIGNKDSEVSKLTSEEAASLESREARAWLGSPVTAFKGERVRIHTFPLGG